MPRKDRRTVAGSASRAPLVVSLEVGSDAHGPAHSLADLRDGISELGEFEHVVVWAGGRKNARNGDVVLDDDSTLTSRTSRWGLGLRVRRQGRSAIAVARLTVRRRPYALHANTSSGALTVALLSLLLRVPVCVVHLREETLSPRRRASVSAAILLKRCTIVAPSGLIEGSLPSWWQRRLGSSFFHVVSDPVSPPACDLHRVRSSTSRFRVATVVTGSPRKAADVFADVVELLADDDRFEWHVYGPRGEPEAGSWLHQQLERARTAVGERYCLHPPATSLVDVLTTFDMVLLPSRDESFGRVAVEAAAAGAVPVWAKNFGHTSTVGSLLGETGFDIDDASTAASILLRLADDPKHADRHRVHCRAVAERFQPVVAAQSMKELWLLHTM